MTIIVFLVDTSASMNQRTYTGTTLLDVTKGAVENFMKIRSRDVASRMDRYMLLTFEDPPANVKAGWKENHATFMAELKNLQAVGLTALGPALKHTFDLLNVNRMQSGIDTYGQGRFPFYLEPTVIICITDGKKLTTANSVQEELNLPMNNAVPGSELTKEPFRWDQRLFSVVLQFPGTPPPPEIQTFVPPAYDAPIDAMCEVTGGRSYAVNSVRALMSTLESLVSKVQAGVVINFEKIGPDPPPLNGEYDKDPSTKENQDVNRGDLGIYEDKKRCGTPTSRPYNCRKLILVPRSAHKGGYTIGHWPIPEAFWPDLSAHALPPRTAHPIVKFSCTPCEPMVVEYVPFDKYELEPSPLTQAILERRQPGTCWQVFIGSSAKYSDIGHPFGYLKPSSNLQVVNLFVMPYNYPVLLPLLDELFKVHKMKPTQKWRQQFESYLKTMPVYYAPPLRRVLSRTPAANFIPDHMDNCMSYNAVSYLRKLKNQAKAEYGRLVASVGQTSYKIEPIKVAAKTTSLLQRKDFNQLLQHYGGDMSHLRHELQEYNTFTIAVPTKQQTPVTYRNPFDIPRKSLLDQTVKMRTQFLNSTRMLKNMPNTDNVHFLDEEQAHNAPIAQMGNYQEYLKKMPTPLRQIDTKPVRQHMFGNPFKVNKNLMIDEADEAMPGQQSRKRTTSNASSFDGSPGSPIPKRKPGPLPKDMPYRGAYLSSTSTSPESTPPASPAPSVDMDESTGQPPTGKPPDDDDDDDVFEDEERPLVINHIDEDEEENMNNHTNGPDNDSSQMSPRPQNGGLSPTEIKISSKKLSAILEHNVRLRDLAIKEVRKPGRNFDALFDHIQGIQGSMEIKSKHISDIILEAMRFKRKGLVVLLEQFKKQSLSLENNNKHSSSVFSKRNTVR